MSSIGLKLESSKDNDQDSEKKEINWGLCFAILKNRGFNHKEILNLSYPQFNAYMQNINDPLAFNVVVPYIGGAEEKEEEKEVSSKEEFLNIIAAMNKDFL